MFEDIFPSKTKDLSKKVMVKDDSCPLCNSTDIEIVTGVFVSNNRYKQFIRCNSCSYTWFLIYNDDLDIIVGIEEE